ncbi:hypothetical protein OG842_36370 [Streptomyces sp. NBC_00376]
MTVQSVSEWRVEWCGVSGGWPGKDDELRDSKQVVEVEGVFASWQ